MRGSQMNFLGLCRRPLSLRIQDDLQTPESVLHCSQFGSYPQRGAFGTSFGADSLLRKKQYASHLSHKMSHSQRSCGTRLLSHDTFWVQQQHDMATFATKRLDAELTWLVHPIAQHLMQRRAVTPTVGAAKCSRPCQPLACPACPHGLKATNGMS